ncbi:MAG TPA: hypothetical protein VNX21_08760 [Candidatus Thermoplasmatota archaeon]|nr:hypothetical protein [Candidatus Thermoplasmatota archaeon]
MRRFWGGTAGILLALAAAMALTLPLPLGARLLDYNLAFLALAAGAAGAWPLLARRRFATMAMALAGAAATLTGFAMLYTKQFSYKDWLTWWHGVTSVAFTLAFLAHWLHNNPRLVGFARRLLAGDRAYGWPLAAAWLAVAGAFAWTWLSPEARARFTDANYLYLSSWAVFLGVAFAYGLWLAFRAPALRRRLARPAARNRARGLVDASLFLANWGALLTGFALLYFATPLRAGDLKYVSKWWHTATSVALLALLALHVGFNARLLAAHARRLDGAAPPPAGDAEPRAAP